MITSKITQKQAERIARKHTEWKKERKASKDEKKFKKKHGFNAVDCWNLDTTIAAFILPRITYLRDHQMGIPGHIEFEIMAKYNLKPDEDSMSEEIEKECIERWNEILNQIAGAMVLILEDEVYTLDNGKIDEEAMRNKDKEIECGLACLAEYFRSLWD